MNKPASSIPFSPFRWNAIKRATAVLALASLAACGGGSDDESALTSAKSFKGVVTNVVSPSSFTVDGIPVDASGAQATPQGLTTGSRVELHGQVVNGVFVARRVELDDDDDDDDDNDDDNELKGRVTAFTSPTSFSVDGISVDATAVPMTLAVGDLVEIHGDFVNGVLLARRIELEDDEDDDEDDDELEGRVTAFTSPTSFSVNGIPVDATAVPTTLAVGDEVEIHGAIVNGVLVASRIELEDDDDDDDEDNSGPSEES